MQTPKIIQTYISPRPRKRPEPLTAVPPADAVANVTPGKERQQPQARTVAPSKPSTSSAGKKPTKAEKHVADGDHPVGYCRPPKEHQFKPGNQGGPGRPKKDTKSQDELMRAEFLKWQQVTEGGKRRRRTTRELVPGLLVKATLQKLSPKELRALQDEARRLFPERAADGASIVACDPQADIQYVREMISAIQIGEPTGKGTDPLADFVTSVFDADDGDDGDDSWDEGNWNADHEEQSDEAA